MLHFNVHNCHVNLIYGYLNSIYKYNRPACVHIFAVANLSNYFKMDDMEFLAPNPDLLSSDHQTRTHHMRYTK